jgi:hypothetical protein
MGCTKKVSELINRPVVSLFILLQQNKKRREPGKKCHARNYDAQLLVKVSSFPSFLLYLINKKIQ